LVGWLLGAENGGMERAEDLAISVSGCWELLRAGWFGRMGLSVDALPSILPVEYSVDGDELAVCLGQYRLSERSLNNAVIAFATDSVDPTTHKGWTVQLQGQARLLEPARAGADCGQHEHGQIVYVTPQTIAGQRLQLCPFGAGLPGAERR
jgi:hypothetical protein